MIESSRKDFFVRKDSGPRHLVFDWNNQYLYLITEFSGTVISYQYNKGDLIFSQEIPLDSVPEKGGGAIVISPDKTNLFGSMREGNDGVCIFNIKNDGNLTKNAYYSVSEHPRDIAISPNGKYLLVAAMKSNKIELFEIIDRGILRKSNSSIKVHMPTFVDFLVFKN